MKHSLILAPHPLNLLLPSVPQAAVAEVLKGQRVGSMDLESSD